MTDFRDRLYRSYVSGFKKDASRRSPQSMALYQRWSEAKLLPLLEGVARDAPILELGCGSGDMLRVLASHGFSRARGVDVSREQVSIAVERGLDAEWGDVFQALDARRDACSAIVALDFVEHFERAEIERLFDAIHAALIPGGILLLQTPNGAGLFPRQVMYGDFTHVTIFSPGSLTQVLEATGFQEVVFREAGPTSSGWKGMLRSTLWSGIRGAANLVRKIETGKSQQIWTENLICRSRKPLRPTAGTA